MQSTALWIIFGKLYTKPMITKERLGERLVGAELISRPQLDEALKLQRQTGKNLGETLIGLGYLSEDTLVRVLCEQSGVPFFAEAALHPEPGVANALPEDIARTYTAVPLRQQAGRLWVAMANPFDISAVTAIERATGRAIKIAAAPRAAIENLLSKPAEVRFAAPPEVSSAAVAAPAPDSPEMGTVAEIVDEIVQRGVALQATDIHIEPLERNIRVRFRIDGVLQDGKSYPRALHSGLITRLKIMSNLNIAENRLPQDGRFRVTATGTDIDVRLSTFPTMHGEDIVLRLLDKTRMALNLEALGISPADLELLRSLMARPHGLIAVTGPTGSGKTTTLYSALAELNTAERCVITLEDPIEYELPGIRQSQVNPRAGLTFASGLRSILRHDPDTILVGEMRDHETVQIGLSAAMTGHLVLTTLHTNTAAGTIPRLIDMGAEPFLLASTLLLLASQRLVRKLCPKCRAPADIPIMDAKRFALSGHVIYRAVGCRECRGTGYRGRLGVFEFLPITPEIITAIYDRRAAEDIHRMSGRSGLLEDGLAKVRAGITSLDELMRVIAS